MNVTSHALSSIPWTLTVHSGSSVSAIPYIKKGNWVAIPWYARWKAEVATPSFVAYLQNKIDLSQLTSQLVAGWDKGRGH